MTAPSGSEPKPVELILLMHTGRSISDDHWEEIDAAHIRVWEKAKALFRVREYDGKAPKVRIEIDWSPILARLRLHYRTMSRLTDPSVTNKEKIRFPTRPVRVKCSVRIMTAQTTGTDNGVHQALRYTESYLHDLFLTLNLAAPGCCSLWRASLRPRDEHPRWMGSQDLALSEYPFDNAYMGTYWSKWPVPKLLEVEQVLEWFQAVRSGTNQIPENRTEKVMFALMHICKADLSLDTIIWLFYALETFYDTQPGENRRALTNRIGLILSPNEKQRAYLKNELNKLYTIRSGFAHGGRDISHPMNDEQLDKRVEGKYREIMDASEFGFATLLASIQAAIERRCSEFNFNESLVGVPIRAN